MNPSGSERKRYSNPARAAPITRSAAGPMATSSPSTVTRRNASSVKSSRALRTTVISPPGRHMAGAATRMPGKQGLSHMRAESLSSNGHHSIVRDGRLGREPGGQGGRVTNRDWRNIGRSRGRSRLAVIGLGRGLQEAGEAAGEQVGVTGPARGQVVAVGHHEGWRVVGRGAARGEGYRSSLELAGWVVQGGFDLILDIGRVG